MYMISINADSCEGCGQCVDLCPVHILGMEGDKAIVSGDAMECMGCETCTGVCPADACTIQEM